MNDHERQWDEQHSDSQADTERLDFVALRADDQFLDALSRDAPVLTGDDDEYRLAVLLSGGVATACPRRRRRCRRSTRSNTPSPRPGNRVVAVAQCGICGLSPGPRPLRSSPPPGLIVVAEGATR